MVIFPKLEVARQIILPKGKPFAGIVGAGIGLAGDLGNFVTDSLRAPYLLGVFAIATGAFLILCLNTIGKARAADSQALQIDCAQCEGFRISLYAVVAFGILMLIGQGESASERIGSQLGLIQRDVSDIREAMASNILIERPEAAEEFYHNAYLHLRSHNDPRAASTALDDMYARHSPNKMDAAELYWEARAPSMQRSALIRRMETLAREKRDANLAVVASRNAPPQERIRLLALARELDPENPFGHWDYMAAQQTFIESAGDVDAAHQAYREQLEGLDRAIPLLESRPVGDLYFRPQYAANPLDMARMQRPMVARNVENYDRLANGGRYFQ